MIEPIVDEASHKKALERIEALWDAEPGTPEAAELDALATLVEAYERKQFPIPPPDPIQAIQVRLEDLGWTRKQLEPLIGSRARVSEVLSGRRALTLPMIRKIHREMGIPLEVLIGPGPGVRKTKAKPKKAPARAKSREAVTEVKRRVSSLSSPRSASALPKASVPPSARTSRRTPQTRPS